MLHHPLQAVASGVPTVDVAAAVQRAANQLATLQQMISQLDQLRAQYERMGQQLQAITETRDLKGLLNLKDIESLIDPSALAAIRELESAGVSEVGILNSQRMHAQAIKAAQAIDKRKADLQKVLDAASKTKDAKASSDLTARATAMNAILLNEMLYQMELQKAAAAKNILDEYKLTQESASHYASGKANPYKLRPYN
jgi:type IV secretion system protein VirB5